MATASTIVRASTASTSDAKNAAVTADPACKLNIARFPVKDRAEALPGCFP
jgi:hypothetical protein